MRAFNPMQSSRYNSLLNPEENRSVVRSCLRFFFNNKRFISSWVLYTLLLLSGFFACFLMGTINLVAPRLLDIIGSHNGIYQLAQQSPLLFSCICFSISVLCWYGFYYTNFAITHTLMQRLQNKPCSFADGFRQVKHRKWRILQWALFAATAHQIMATAERCSNSYVRPMVSSILSCSWVLASFFVVPIMLRQDIGPWRALRISANTFRNNYGRIIRLGLPFYAVHLILSGMITGFFYLKQLYPYNTILQHIDLFVGIIILAALVVLWDSFCKAIKIIASGVLYLQYFDAPEHEGSKENKLNSREKNQQAST